MSKQSILQLQGAIRLNPEHRHYPTREEKFSLRRTASTAAGTLATLAARRQTSAELSAVQGYYVAEQLPWTYLTETLAESLAIEPARFALDAANTMRVILRDTPLRSNTPAKDFQLTYQVQHRPRVPTVTIADILIRPTRGHISIEFGNHAELPLEGTANVIGAPEVVTAVLGDIALVREYAVMQ